MKQHLSTASKQHLSTASPRVDNVIQIVAIAADPMRMGHGKALIKELVHIAKKVMANSDSPEQAVGQYTPWPASAASLQRR